MSCFKQLIRRKTSADWGKRWWPLLGEVIFFLGRRGGGCKFVVYIWPYMANLGVYIYIYII